MKTKINVLLVGLALATLQACGPAPENKVSNEAPAEENPAPLTLAERQMLLENDRREMENTRRLELEELARVSPYYTLPDGKLVFYKAETAPSYVGGEKALIKFLKDNLKYPAAARDAGLEGTVFVDFIVGANGSVRETEVTSFTYDHVNQEFTDEALRVVKMMPTWSPGLQNGKPVDVKFSVPITFEMM
jgi:TonB family protein